MTEISMKQLLESRGAFWPPNQPAGNPKMKPYIFGARNGIHIIDLPGKTVDHCLKTRRSGRAQPRGVRRTRSFRRYEETGTEAIKEEAERCGMFYVHNRWLGGTLTNFSTIGKALNA